MGEIRYIVGKVLGHAHCALCDVTHGITGKKRSFRAVEQALPVPLSLVHLDEQSPEIATLTEGRTPAVVGKTEDGLVFLLGPEQLEVGGDVDRFAEVLHQAIADRGTTAP